MDDIVQATNEPLARSEMGARFIFVNSLDDHAGWDPAFSQPMKAQYKDFLFGSWGSSFRSCAIPACILVDRSLNNPHNLRNDMMGWMFANPACESPNRRLKRGIQFLEWPQSIWR